MDDNGIVKYVWDFRDGSDKVRIANPTHTFKKAGTYKVILIVKDAGGLADIDPIYITVTDSANEGPVAKASGTPLSGPAPLDVAFTGDNSTDDHGITRYKWVFGDGTISAEANPTHTFESTGTYQVKLVVFDAEGERKATFLNVTATGGNKAPVAVAKANPTQGIAPHQVAFNAGSSTDDKGITGYTWDFGDGRAATAKNPSRTYNTPGVYQAKLTVTDGSGLTSTDTVTITVDGASSGGGGSDDGGDGGDGGGSSGPSDIPAGAVKASSFGFKAGDASDALNKAMNSSAKVIVIDKQSSDWIVKPTKFFYTKNKTIIFEPGVVLRAKKGAFYKTNHSLFTLYHPENVVIEGYGATLQMNKSEYTTGEWRHALIILGGRNVTVKGLTIKDSGGDGVNIHAGGLKYSENITIQDVVSTNNRRNALTVISGRNVWIKNCEFSYSSGTKPESGIHLEPEEFGQQLTNINFENCKIHHNDGTGFSLGTRHLNSSSPPISVNVKNSNFSMNVIAPNEGRVETEILANSGQYGNPVKGLATFSGLTFEGTKSRIFLTKKPDSAFKVVFNNCTANNVIQNGGVSPIALQAAPNVNNSLGGIEFNNFYIQYSKNQSFMTVTGPRGFPLKNITGTFTVKEPSDKPINYQYGISPNDGENYKVNYNHVN